MIKVCLLESEGALLHVSPYLRHQGSGKDFSEMWNIVQVHGQFT